MLNAMANSQKDTLLYIMQRVVAMLILWMLYLNVVCKGDDCDDALDENRTWRKVLSVQCSMHYSSNVHEA